MRNTLLFISLSLNILVLSAMGYFGYYAYKSFKSTSASALALPAIGTIIDVIDINDGGYKANYYIIDYGSRRIVVYDYNSIVPLKKIGDSVKIQVMKNSFNGINTVSYNLLP